MNEKKYLAIYEAPCVGTVAETFTADNDDAAEKIAWETSVNNKHYVAGGYDLYSIVYNPFIHRYELRPACPE